MPANETRNLIVATGYAVQCATPVAATLCLQWANNVGGWDTLSCVSPQPMNARRFGRGWSTIARSFALYVPGLYRSQLTTVLGTMTSDAVEL